MIIKRIIALSLVTVLLAVMVSPSFKILSFYKNQAEITAKFCENKDKPVMECNGKCYLKKQLKAVAEKPENKAIPEVSVFIPLAFNNASNIIVLTPAYSNKRVSFFTVEQAEVSYQAEIFTPPKSFA